MPHNKTTPHISAEELARSSKLGDLRGCPLFGGQREQDLEALARATTITTLAAGDSLPLKNEQEASLWVVMRGHVEISYSDSRGRKVTVMLLGPGDVFGSLTPEEEPTHAISCAALTSSCVAHIRPNQFRTLMGENPDICYLINKANMDRMVRLQRRMAMMLTSTTQERLATTLLELEAILGDANGRRGSQVRGLSHSRLAELVGSSREMVTRALARIIHEGFAEINLSDWFL